MPDNAAVTKRRPAAWTIALYKHMIVETTAATVVFMVVLIQNPVAFASVHRHIVFVAHSEVVEQRVLLQSNRFTCIVSNPAATSATRRLTV